MSDNTALVPVNLEQLPSTQIGGDDLYAELAKGGDYLGRMQLYTKGKAVNKGLIPPGHYGIPERDDEIIDLGTTVDIIPLARRPKAIDMTDTRGAGDLLRHGVAGVQADRREVATSRNRTANTAPPSWSTSGPPAASWSSSAATSPTASRPRRSSPSCRSPRPTSTPRRRPART